MAAIDTFEWLVRQLWPQTNESTRWLIDEKRKELLALRNENERLLFIENLLQEMREMKRWKGS